MREFVYRAMAETTIRTGIENPLTGVTPSLEVFGVTLQQRVSIILGGIWALALVVCAAAVIIAGAKWAIGSNVTHNSTAAMQGSDDFKQAIMAFGFTVGAGVIIGAIIWIVEG